MTGWNMPPGCSRVPGDEEAPCAVCGLACDDCVCPECPVCGASGDPNCYGDPDGGSGHHGLQLSRAQLASRRRVRIGLLRERLAELEVEVLRLSAGDIPDADVFGGDCPLSRDIREDPDPWA